jgi:hypothetical protein
MDRDELGAFFLVATLAAWALLQLSIVLRLARIAPRWRAAVAFLVPPLSPYWAWKNGLHARAVLWLVALVAWLVSRRALS